MKKKQMWDIKEKAEDPDTLQLYVYGDVEGDIYDWWYGWEESETSANHFKEELNAHPNAKEIEIYINSYGGSVFEGTAIYNQLRRHPANKTVYIDGFACSVASVIAMAGDKIVMPKNALMMIHNPWTSAVGNARELRKAADDLDIITEASRQAYLTKCGDKLDPEELITLMDEETWLTAEQCIEKGLADEYAEEDADMSNAKTVLQKANLSLNQRIDMQKSLAAQLRELVEPPKPDPKPEPEPKSKKLLKMLSAI